MYKYSKSQFKMAFGVVLLTLAGIFFVTMSSGIRNHYGIMLNSLIGHTGVPLTSVSLIFAVGQLVYGLVQPLFGILAAKKGSKYALVSGVFITAAGLILTPFSTSMLSLMLCLGIILPTGVGVLSYGIIIGAIAPKIPSKMILTISGIVNASIGLGNLIMSPIINSLIMSGGLKYGMHCLSIPVLIMLPLAFFVGKNVKTCTSRPVEAQTESPDAMMPLYVRNLFKEALKSKTYQYLMIGFFTCGFHMALVFNHLPAQFEAHGFSSQSAAYAFSIFGVTTIIGSILSGSLCNKLKIKNVLGFFYGLRPLTILFFMIMPKTVVTLTVFTAVLGFSGASTVPAVSGIINKKFGAASIAMLYGLVFVVHQIGGFSSAWLGGLCFNMTGSYTAIWIASLVLSTTASTVSFAIGEKK